MFYFIFKVLMQITRRFHLAFCHFPPKNIEFLTTFTTIFKQIVSVVAQLPSLSPINFSSSSSFGFSC